MKPSCYINTFLTAILCCISCVSTNNIIQIYEGKSQSLKHTSVIKIEKESFGNIEIKSLDGKSITSYMEKLEINGVLYFSILPGRHEIQFVETIPDTYYDGTKRLEPKIQVRILQFHSERGKTYVIKFFNYPSKLLSIIRPGVFEIINNSDSLKPVKSFIHTSPSKDSTSYNDIR